MWPSRPGSAQLLLDTVQDPAAQVDQGRLGAREVVGDTVDFDYLSGRWAAVERDPRPSVVVSQ